ncbi:hypothetical protein BC828DRAFT_394381, partial [Blastocladiella britannica]
MLDSALALASDHATTLMVASALLVATALPLAFRAFSRHESRKHRYQYLKYLLRGCGSNIKAASTDAAAFAADEIAPALADASALLLLHDTTAPNSSNEENSPATRKKNLERAMRRLQYLEEGVQRQLFGLDNIKPNASLIEFVHRYPLPKGKDDDDDANDASDEQEERPEGWTPADATFESIIEPFTPQERASATRTFEDIKTQRKAVVRRLLTTSEEIDAMVATLKARIVKASSTAAS